MICDLSVKGNKGNILEDETATRANLFEKVET